MNEVAMKVKEQWHSVLVGALGLVMLLLSGCMSGPDYHTPQPAVLPGAWAGVEKTGQPSVVTAQPADLSGWWRQFNDPILSALVEEALKANLDLALAEARLRQARAMRGVAVGGLWPSATVSGSYQREHTAGVTPGNGSQSLYEAGLDAVWELDIFGGQRRAVESANANIEAAVENLQDVQVSLIAEVALNYVQLRGYQQEIVVAQNNLKSQQHTAEITRKLYKVGFDSGLDVANADSNAATTESQIPVFETEAQQSIYALSVLLARPPADLLLQLSPTGNLPSTPAQIPAGIPSDLLRRRPDIREAEAQLHSATAQIGVAVADLFPTFSLTGEVEWQNKQFSSWLTKTNRSFFVGPSASWSIFQGGAIVSNIHVQEALRDQALITYQETVLGALQDVENALIAYSKEQQHHKVLNEAVAANEKAVDLSLKLYTEGMTDFLNVLIAQSSLYSSQNALVQSECSIVTDLIALYKALGGGWEAAP
jgi:NodT family efflux transporter outer membrane factor (OMF) lipoprotein